MADDLKTIDQQIDTAINPAALPGQILHYLITDYYMQ